MKQTLKITFAAAALIGSAAFTASAGAPDADMTDVTATETVDTRSTLSPAELRNMLNVQVDNMNDVGIEIDRTEYDGFGADPDIQDGTLAFIYRPTALEPYQVADAQ